MGFLLTSDVHATDQPRDSSRFRLFPWLRQQQDIHEVDATFILGDLCQNKDKHSSTLVNSLVDSLKKLKPPVYVLKGNHDYLGNENNPFFRFLSAIPGITFCTDISLLSDFKVCLIPHQTSQAALDKAFRRVPDGWLAMCHQTFTGAKSELGSALTGMALPPNKAREIFSGDIHAPQELSCPNGIVAYVGSPIHVRFGDQFKPRVLLLEDDKKYDLYFDGPSKLSLTVRDPSELSCLKKGDQVKVTLELVRSEAVEWQNHKQAILDYCRTRGAEVYGIEIRLPPARKRPKLDNNQPSNKKSNLDYFSAFCSAEMVPIQMKQAGLKFVQDSVG